MTWQPMQLVLYDSWFPHFLFQRLSGLYDHFLSYFKIRQNFGSFIIYWFCDLYFLFFKMNFSFTKLEIAGNSTSCVIGIKELVRLDMIHCQRTVPISVVGLFIQSSSARHMSNLFFLKIFFAIFTFASSLPFPLGWQGSKVTCSKSQSCANFPNSELTNVWSLSVINVIGISQRLKFVFVTSIQVLDLGSSFFNLGSG